MGTRYYAMQLTEPPHLRTTLFDSFCASDPINVSHICDISILNFTSDRDIGEKCSFGTLDSRHKELGSQYQPLSNVNKSITLYGTKCRSGTMLVRRWASCVPGEGHLWTGIHYDDNRCSQTGWTCTASDSQVCHAQIYHRILGYPRVTPLNANAMLRGIYTTCSGPATELRVPALE
ncbi:hypothetical protein CC78DRAFT_585905 [Lojkania enalia]|uniref:Uncharacterized protein n=1 Tax=Lojkania enalia TaxID=147567 RepID=A0A9P4JZP8_9PLEO|nr:hypothetical protein CC78DRAFT_585905 [Didymosphaeria enalia]